MQSSIQYFCSKRWSIRDHFECKLDTRNACSKRNLEIKWNRLRTFEQITQKQMGICLALCRQLLQVDNDELWTQAIWIVRNLFHDLNVLEDSMEVASYNFRLTFYSVNLTGVERSFSPLILMIISIKDYLKSNLEYITFLASLFFWWSSRKKTPIKSQKLSLEFHNLICISEFEIL